MTTKHKDHKLCMNANSAAYCTCNGWAVEGFSAEYAKRNHIHHLAGLPDQEKEPFLGQKDKKPC